MIILFDIGNVTCKPLDEIDIFNISGSKIEYDLFIDYWRNSKASADAHQGLISDKEHIEDLLSYCKSDVSVEDYYNEYITMVKGRFDKTKTIIDKLQEKKYKVGILSNLREMDYFRHKREVDFEKFDYLFFSYEIKLLKPNKDIYEYVIKECKCSPEEIYFFDDLEVNVNAAKKLGINAFQVTGDNIDETFNTLNLI